MKIANSSLFPNFVPFLFLVLSTNSSKFTENAIGIETRKLLKNYGLAEIGTLKNDDFAN